MLVWLLLLEVDSSGRDGRPDSGFISFRIHRVLVKHISLTSQMGLIHRDANGAISHDAIADFDAVEDVFEFVGDLDTDPQPDEFVAVQGGLFVLGEHDASPDQPQPGLFVGSLDPVGGHFGQADRMHGDGSLPAGLIVKLEQVVLDNCLAAGLTEGDAWHVRKKAGQPDVAASQVRVHCALVMNQ